MKSLVQYIKEAQEASEKKSFTFNFKGLDNGKETIESLVKMAEDKDLEHESTEDSFTITLTREVCQNERGRVDGIQDVLQQYSDIIRKDSANASSESHAQFTAKFEKTVDDMVSFIDNTTEEPEEDPKEDENKSDDKKKEEE